MTPKDWTLLVIAAAEGAPLSPVQLQKALFILGENLSGSPQAAGQPYKFRPYDYGPFCAAIYEDAGILHESGLVTIAAQAPRSFREYTITPEGLREAGVLREQIPGDLLGYVEQVVSWVRSLSFNELVRAVYRAYPEMRANSVFQD